MRELHMISALLLSGLSFELAPFTFPSVSWGLLSAETGHPQQLKTLKPLLFVDLTGFLPHCGQHSVSYVVWSHWSECWALVRNFVAERCCTGLTAITWTSDVEITATEGSPQTGMYLTTLGHKIQSPVPDGPSCACQVWWYQRSSRACPVTGLLRCSLLISPVHAKPLLAEAAQPLGHCALFPFQVQHGQQKQQQPFSYAFQVSTSHSRSHMGLLIPDQGTGYEKSLPRASSWLLEVWEQLDCPGRYGSPWNHSGSLLLLLADQLGSSPWMGISMSSYSWWMVLMLKHIPNNSQKSMGWKKKLNCPQLQTVTANPH